MLLHRCRPTPRPVFGILKYGLAGAVVLIAAVILAFSLWDFVGIAEGFALALVAGGLAYAGWVKLKYDFTSIEITDRDISVHAGIISKSHQLIPLARIQDALVKQSLFDRWFRVGQLFVSTAGTSGYELHLRDLEDKDIAKILDIIKYFKEGEPHSIQPMQPDEEKKGAPAPSQPAITIPS